MLADGLDPLDYLDSLCTPGDRIRATLLDDHSLSNREVALMCRVTPEQAQEVRAALIRRGVIPPERVIAPTGHRREYEFKARPAPPAILRRGSCVNVIPSPWVSGDPAERQRAIEICRACIAQAACLEWSLSLPESDRAIYAGLGASGRARLRLQRAGRPVPFSMTVAGKNAARARRRAVARRAAQQQDQAAGGAA